MIDIYEKSLQFSRQKVLIELDESDEDLSCFIVENESGNIIAMRF